MPDIPFRIYTKDINKQNIKFLCTKVFITALFAIEKDWIQTKCPWTGDWLNILWHHYTLEYHAAVKRNKQDLYILIGESNGTPLQFSCLENPRDAGAWWAAVYAVAKSQTRLSDFTFMRWRRKWQPTPVFLPGESQGRGSLVSCRLWGRTESDTTEAT